MKLTVKNIIKVLEKEYSECPFCDGEPEICSYTKKGEEGKIIKVFCPDCGATTENGGLFAEILKTIEKTPIEVYTTLEKS